jgi:hypothetical protein
VIPIISGSIVIPEYEVCLSQTRVEARVLESLSPEVLPLEIPNQLPSALSWIWELVKLKNELAFSLIVPVAKSRM